MFSSQKENKRMAISIKKPDDLKLMGGMETPNGITVSDANKNPIDMYSTTPESVNVGNKPTATDIYQDALSKAEKEKNYENYYNTAMQLYNFEQNSKKYLANSMANAGLNTQGYGSSQMAGISNNAMNLYSQNLANLNKANTEADLAALERKNADDLENDKQLVTFMYNANSPEEINTFLKNYGYVDDNGNVDTSKMSPYIKSVYDQAVGNTGNSSYTINDLGSNKTSNDADAKTYAEIFKDSYKVLVNMVERNDISNGQVVLLYHQGSKLYLKYNNGEFSEISSSEFYGSKNQRFIDNGKEVDADTWDNTSFDPVSGGPLAGLASELKKTGDKYKDGNRYAYKYNGKTYTIYYKNGTFWCREE